APDGAVGQRHRVGGNAAAIQAGGVVAADGAVGQIRRVGEDAAAVEGGDVAADGAPGQVDLNGEDATCGVGEVVLDRAADDGEHARRIHRSSQDCNAAALPGDVAGDGAADQRHVPRVRQRVVGDAAAEPGGPVAGDDAVLDHQVRVAHPDASSAPVEGAA